MFIFGSFNFMYGKTFQLYPFLILRHLRSKSITSPTDKNNSKFMHGWKMLTKFTTLWAQKVHKPLRVQEMVMKLLKI